MEKPIENVSMGEEMRQLHARMDSMEIARRRAPNVGDINEAGSKEMEEEGVVGEEVAKERLLRDVVKMGAKAKI
jgi:hypothetical protein